MNLELLREIGLCEGEILVYEALLNNGEMSIKPLLEATRLKKGDCYNKIYALVEKGLAEELEKAKKKHFRLTHPQNLEALIETREKEIRNIKSELSAVMPALLSGYNLAYDKPGVKIFEGEEAINILFKDSLEAKTEILAFIDIESIAKNLGRRASWYTKERHRRGIKKYNLVFDSKYNRAYVEKYPLDQTFERMVDLGGDMKDISLQIYDNKIVFHTLKRKTMIGVIIDDPIIVKLVRNIFWWMWERSVDRA